MKNTATYPWALLVAAAALATAPLAAAKDYNYKYTVHHGDDCKGDVEEAKDKPDLPSESMNLTATDGTQARTSKCENYEDVASVLMTFNEDTPGVWDMRRWTDKDCKGSYMPISFPQWGGNSGDADNASGGNSTECTSGPFTSISVVQWPKKDGQDYGGSSPSSGSTQSESGSLKGGILGPIGSGAGIAARDAVVA